MSGRLIAKMSSPSGISLDANNPCPEMEDLRENALPFMGMADFVVYCMKLSHRAVCRSKRAGVTATATKTSQPLQR